MYDLGFWNEQLWKKKQMEKFEYGIIDIVSMLNFFEVIIGTAVSRMPFSSRETWKYLGVKGQDSQHLPTHMYVLNLVIFCCWGGGGEATIYF